MIQVINFDQLAAVADEARQQTSNKLWQNAITKALSIAQTLPFCLTGDILRVQSESKPDTHYQVSTGLCATEDGHLCPAYMKGHPCKHRALRRLLLLYVKQDTTIFSPTEHAESQKVQAAA